MFPADQHDEIDALMVERNGAQAEAQLWLRRCLTMQQERDAALAESRAADKCLEEWQAAYATLLQDFRRLEVRFDYLCSDDENREWLLVHLDPFLPASMQDAKRREAEPVLYATIAQLRDAA